MTYILRNWGSFLKIPVASSTVNSLLLRRLEKKERTGSFTKSYKGIPVHLTYGIVTLFNDNSKIKYSTSIGGFIDSTGIFLQFSPILIIK